MTPVPLPEGPWQKLALDIVGPFETGPADCKFAITMVDYYSKWPEVCFAPQCTTTTVINFMRSVFNQKGNPMAVVTDNGPQLNSSELSSFLEEWVIQHIRTTIYHPEGNGAVVGRLNRVLKENILTTQREKAPWKAYVTEFLQVYRATPHVTTGTSPFQLMYGWNMRTKLSIQLKLTAAQEDHELRDRVAKKQLHLKTYMPRLINCTQEALWAWETLCMSRMESPSSVSLLKWHSREGRTATHWLMGKLGMLHSCRCCQRRSLFQQKNRGLQSPLQVTVYEIGASETENSQLGSKTTSVENTLEG